MWCNNIFTWIWTNDEHTTCQGSIWWSTNSKTHSLILAQVLFLGDKLEHLLICPNQVCVHGVVADDIPIHLMQDKQVTHSIYFPEEQIWWPLKMYGCLSYLNTHLPSAHEIEWCTWLTMTDDMEWDPHSPTFEQKEIAMIDSDLASTSMNQCSIYAFNITMCSISPVLSAVSHVIVINTLLQGLHEKVMLSTSATITNERWPTITKEELSQSWGISLETARCTLQVTTQKGVRNAIHPLHWCHHMQQQQLWYNQLGTWHGHFASDPMFAMVKSIQANMMGQIFVNDVDFLHFTPMWTKPEAGDALAEFIQDVGIPSALYIPMKLKN